MKIHHLNCGSMRPHGAPEGLVCHVFLIETGDGLVLVDSGLGLQDIAHPGKRFGPARFFVRPAFEESETAIRQVQQRGFDPIEVRDVVLTHFDADHVGGIADFPWARVHLTSAEAHAAYHPQTFFEKERYKPAQRDHNPTLIRHSPAEGDTWRGFAAAKEILSGLVLINQPGHTRGHAAVAVDAGHRWVLHVGDSFYHHGQIDGTSKGPASMRAMERLIAFDWKKVQANHERLTELWNAAEPDLLLVNAHDPSLLREAQRGTQQRPGE